MDTSVGNGEDLMTLEAEISELQRENARVESQMLRLKNDITAMESHLSHGEKVKITHFARVELLKIPLISNERLRSSRKINTRLTYSDWFGL